MSPIRMFSFLAVIVLTGLTSTATMAQDAPSDPMLSASARVVHNITFVETLDLRLAPEGQVGTSRWCASPHWIDTTDLIVFGDTEEVTGCGRAIVPFSAPDASTVTMRMEAARRIGWSVEPPAGEHTFLQDLRLLDGHLPLAERDSWLNREPLLTTEVLPSTAPSTDMTLIEIPLPDTVVGHWSLDLRFADHGTRLAPDQPPQDMGARFHATVEWMELVYEGVVVHPAPAEVVSTHVSGRDEVIRERTRLVVPEAWSSQGWRIDGLEVSVLSKEAPRWIGRESGGGTWSEGPPGTWTTRVMNADLADLEVAPLIVETTQRESVSAQAVLLVPAAALLVAPVGLLGLPLLFRDRRRGSVAAVRPQWHRVGPVQMAAAVAVAAWVGMLVWILASGRGPLVASWPLGAFALRVYAVDLALILTAAVMVWWVYRRRVVILDQDNVLMTKRAEELEMFLHGTTHDLKTPILALDWLTRDLEEDLGEVRDDPAVRETLTRIKRSLGGMEHLVQDLLEMARVDHTDGGARGPTDLLETYDQVVDTLREAAVQKEARMVLEADGPMDVAMEEGHVRLVLQNLIGNAIKYGRPTGGTVHVSAVAKAGARVVLTVSDDGEGVPDDEKERVWGMFQRGVREREQGTDGTGLGLALVRKVVEAYGGAVELSSSATGGASFSVVLPLAHDP